MDKIIEINHFTIPYTNLNNYDFSVERNSVIGIYGVTGTGKTSLLNKITDIYSSSYNISYVFQDNKLLENLTSLKNVSLPLENFMNKKDATDRAIKMLKLLKLESKINAKINVLSGGERQRVNLARAFAFPCDILLLDEPFSSQDELTRNEIIKITDKIIKERKITTIIVSHNKSDLDFLCDEIVQLP